MTNKYPIVIFQQNRNSEHDFMSYKNYVAATGSEGADMDEYEMTYCGTIPTDDLEAIFHMFTVEKPLDFFGHSMSVGDIVFNGKGLWYCDPFGWKKVEWKVSK